MARSAKIQCIPRDVMAQKLLLLEGFTRAGKFLLGKICDGFDHCEHFQYVPLIEQLPPMMRLKFIEPSAGITLMRLVLDESAYSMRIGRNLNFRYSDSSSLYKNINVDDYIKRGFAPDGQVIIEEFKKSPRYSVFIGHEMMSNMDIAFDAFPSMHVLSLQRHPIDLVHSWWVRKMGERETKDPLTFNPFYKMDNTLLPWFAMASKNEYARMKPIDRVIGSIDHLTDLSRKRYAGLTKQQQKRILFLTHECLIEDPWKAIGMIQPFLGVKAQEGMSMILNRERCGRSLSLKARDEKWQQIKKAAKPASVKKMEAMCAWYEQKVGCGIGQYE